MAREAETLNGLRSFGTCLRWLKPGEVCKSKGRAVIFPAVDKFASVAPLSLLPHRNACADSVTRI